MAARSKQDLLDVLGRTTDPGWLDPILADEDAVAPVNAAADALAALSAQAQVACDNTTISNSAAGRGGSSTVTLVRFTTGTSGVIPKGYVFVDSRGFQAVSLSDVTVGSGASTVVINVVTTRKTELANTINDPGFTVGSNLPVKDNGGTNALVSSTTTPAGYPPIVGTTFFTVQSSTPIANGASDWLASVGHERGQLRQANEDDAAFRLRVRNVPDAVSPVAISQGVGGAATARQIPAPVVLECLNPGCSAQALADAKVDWFDSVFFSGLIDIDGNVLGGSPAVDFMEDVQPDLVNLKPRETVSLREARCYFRVFETGLLPDRDDGRMFFDNAFFDDEIQGFPDIHEDTKTLGALMAVWEEANRKRAGGVRFDEYLEATTRLTGVGSSSAGTEVTAFTLTPPPGFAWFLQDGHFGWDAITPPTSANARIKFTFDDGSTYFTTVDFNPWGSRIRGVDVIGDLPTTRIITRIDGKLTSDGVTTTNLVGNFIVIQFPWITGPDLTTLRYWFEADAGITKDGSNNVTNMLDLTGNGWDLYEPSGGHTLPTWQPSTVNGLPGVYFGNAFGGASTEALVHYGGPHDTVNAAYPPGTPYPFDQDEPHTLYVVCEPLAGAPPGGGVAGGMLMTDRDEFIRELWTLAANQQRVARNSSGTPALLYIDPAVDYTNTPLLITFNWDGADMHISVNGGTNLATKDLLLGGAASIAFPHVADTTTNHVMELGGSPVDESGFQGTIQACMLGADATPNTRTVKYLHDKYGFTF
jgi:hypothetical protein